MDKDDPFNRPSGNHDEHHDAEHDFNDDARYDDATSPEVREEEYAAGQEEWDQPIDEFAEEEQPTHQAQQKHDPFADEGPLEDEFSEHSEADHDHEQNHDHDHDLDNQDEPAPAARTAKPSVAGMKPPSNLMKYVPYVGGGLAAVAIAFFGFQQFMGGSESSPTQPSLEHQNTWDSASANPSQQPSQPAANEFQQPAPTAQPTDVASNTQTNMITPTQVPEQQVQAPLPQAEPQQVQQAPAQQANNALETRIAELTQQLDTMKQTQDQLNQKLQQATATPPSMDENSKAATRALEDRIAQLEQKLTAAQSASSSVSPSPSVDAPTTKSSRKSRRAAVDSALDAPATEHASRSNKASTDFMVAKKPKRTKKRSSAHANSTAGTEGFSPVDSRPFQGWILRSAQPGSAWLSQGPYSSDLRRVVPGDKVQGLGTVTAIRQVAGRWVVEGTQGAVR